MRSSPSTDVLDVEHHRTDVATPVAGNQFLTVTKAHSATAVDGGSIATTRSPPHGKRARSVGSATTASIRTILTLTASTNDSCQLPRRRQPRGGSECNNERPPSLHRQRASTATMTEWHCLVGRRLPDVRVCVYTVSLCVLLCVWVSASGC